MEHQPTAQELTDAIREWIVRDVIGALDSYGQFRARVALSSLGIIKRELNLRPALDGAVRQRLCALLGRDGSAEELDRALCQAIRAGTIGLPTPGLLAHLRETTMARLAIDQPKYASYLAALGPQASRDQSAR